MKGICAAGAVLGLVAASLLTGCRLPGKPGPGHVPQRPDDVSDFQTLYAQNCQACHGVQGRDGMAVSLASPAYIAYAGRDHIVQATEKGVGGSLMPAFVTSEGGLLTDRQIRVLADGIVTRWADAPSLHGVAPPPYESQVQGDAAAGEELYRADCQACHAPGPQSILSATYLALVSDGGLRSLLVAGKPSQGMPDWRGYPGGPLSDKQLADLVAFLGSHRSAAPGQPYPNRQGLAAPGSASAAQGQQQLASEAGPATGGPRKSAAAVPTATLRHPESVTP